ncbi:hypothetical protein [Acerihabitans arboris]|uniref:Uncharacterized protein n=1 Tax=Acerihabitans arboris TaxID=2691583 RepID=A0A845SMR4_9GAMM|nr:hypothetical protein [Acerihabitans arboris]NDL63911.1 hypothetical protein [Acerihabitans arboris]
MCKFGPSFYEFLFDSNIEFIKKPDGNTIIFGALNLTHTGIRHIPQKLIIVNSLIMRYCDIESLPAGLQVFDDLDLKNTPIKRLPNDLHVGGSLFLENSQISELPDNLEIEGGLDLENTPIKKLPHNLCVGDYLNIQGTNITDLPEDLYVGHSLLLDNEKISNNAAYRNILASGVIWPRKRQYINRNVKILTKVANTDSSHKRCVFF